MVGIGISFVNKMDDRNDLNVYTYTCTDLGLDNISSFEKTALDIILILFPNRK